MGVLTTKRYLYDLEPRHREVLRFGRARYSYNDSLAVMAFVEVDDGVWETYDMVTVNLGHRPADDIQYVHVNHWADGFVDWLSLIGAGEPTGEYMRSGFVDYPQFRFDLGFFEGLDEVESSIVVDRDEPGELVEVGEPSEVGSELR